MSREVDRKSKPRPSWPPWGRGTGHMYAIVRKVRHYGEEKVDWVDAVISFVLDLIVFGLCGTIGAVYYGKDGYEYCRFSDIPFLALPTFLMMAGFGNCLLSFFRLFLGLAVSCLQCLFNIAMLVLGSILVLKNYAAWAASVGRESSEAYCHYVPFFFAFGLVVGFAIWFGIILLLVMIVCCLGLVNGFENYGHTTVVRVMVALPTDGRTTVEKLSSKVRQSFRRKDIDDSVNVHIDKKKPLLSKK